MMEKKELDPIELFIDKLASRAFYGYAGEKPLVILAAIETSSGIMRENQLALSEVLRSPILGKQIKRAFINLARRTSKLKDPESSWGNVVTTNEELLIILKEKKSVDEAFRTMTKERTDKIIRKYYTKLGL
ncbi:MAG: hypothetical protein ABIJ47_06080 [Candidatus Bathyarchaeota archaeon]